HQAAQLAVARRRRAAVAEVEISGGVAGREAGSRRVTAQEDVVCLFPSLADDGIDVAREHQRAPVRQERNVAVSIVDDGASIELGMQREAELFTEEPVEGQLRI